ncbi:MAG: glutamyl-tRNA reductase [Deltaproteobacteria bacterium RIFOXYD12_FULL_56_24]|nr:MAG: glutamyl-tRNA reductase [Deltaproteobacteria bacterium RIFOXYD12_FULL_56_24]
MLAESIVIIGVNHKTAPVAVREKLAFSGDCAGPLLTLMNIEGCQECCFLSTCNRVEVIFVASDPAAAAVAVRGFLFAKSGLADAEAQQYSYLYQGREAVDHLYHVATSLDSMVVGEPQILGQLKQAYREALEQKTTGVILNRLLHKSFSVAKRVRTETNIGGSAVSISYAAVQLAKKILGNLQDKSVLLVGAGEMAELAAEHLVRQGIGRVIVANRTLERAALLARRFNGTAVGLAELTTQLAEVDILVSSTGATDLILTKDQVKPLMRQRKNRPLFLIDIAVPRDLDPELNELDNVYLYDIDDLKNVVDVNKVEREKEALRAEGIVAEEVAKFWQWLEGMELSPTITAIRQKADAIREAEVAKTLSNLKSLSESERRSVEMLANAIVNKLLHEPMVFLKNGGPGDNSRTKLALVRQLFGLDKEY